MCVKGIIYSAHIWLPTNTGTLGFNTLWFHLLDAWAGEGIVQVHLAGSPQAHIWRTLRLQETWNQGRCTTYPWISHYVSLTTSLFFLHPNRSRDAFRQRVSILMWQHERKKVTTAGGWGGLRSMKVDFGSSWPLGQRVDISNTAAKCVSVTFYGGGKKRLSSGGFAQECSGDTNCCTLLPPPLPSHPTGLRNVKRSSKR